jgi:uncharacterized protein YqeY
MAMAAAHNRKIELRRDLTDDEMLAVLDKQVKQRRESADLFRQGGRADRADGEEAEAAILLEYLPAQLSDEELEGMARAAIAETGASSPGDMGKVMGRLSPQTKGRADGRTVSELVRRLLAEGGGAG